MKSNYTHVSLVLDRSGSMSSIAQDTIGGFNRFITDQRAVPGDCTVTLVQFDTHAIETVCDARPVHQAPLLNERTFLPRGGTPLYDAIGQTIHATGKFLKDKPEAERPAKVVFVIITDGEENSSREFTQARVFELIKEQRDIYKWEFVFIGANQDAFAVGTALGVAGANCYSNVANTAGTSATYGALSSNLRMMRCGASSSMSFSDKQREEQAKAGLKK